MILRVVLGRFAAGQDAEALVDLRARLTRSARVVDGLESLIAGARRVAGSDAPDASDASDASAGSGPIQAAIVTVWRDADAMIRATGVDEERRFIAQRLELPFQVERVDHYEVAGRTFAGLPAETMALLRILTVTAGPTDEAILVETLRRQQPRLVALGIIASHVGRRINEDRTVEAVHVSVWPDRATILAATGGLPERPLYAAELEAWADHIRLEQFDGIEIAPMLPDPSGPPLLVVDDRARIVDLTASAAAILGMPAEHSVDRALGDVIDWAALLERGILHGDLAWAIPDVGQVILRYVARRDSPVPGRHALLVRRHHDPAPSLDDLDAALAATFPHG
jgi:hypothetical protein